MQASYSVDAKQRMVRAIRKFEPDIVHVHNFFPLLTPSIYDACYDAGVPVVQTLHNYRTICASALLMRAGRICEDCVGDTPWQAVLHGCYRESRLASVPMAHMIAMHRRRGTWQRKVRRFIALTEFAKERFVAAGFPSDRISVKPNFVDDRNSPGLPRAGALFVGRLSVEKGIGTLQHAWEKLDIPLNIAGQGPLLENLTSAALGNIELLGMLAPEDVAEHMSRAAFLVFPSECYEGFPVTLVEAFRQGLPVVASRLGSMAEIIEDGVTGLHFTPGSPADLAEKVRWAAAHPNEMRRMGQNARQTYEDKYTPEVNYRELVAIYEEAIEERQRMNRQ
jgi:glycosyltransferase involved in cell wall biosynthesis